MSDNIAVFMETLKIMGLGMAGIFVVMTIIFLSIMALNAAFKPGKDEQEN